MREQMKRIHIPPSQHSAGEHISAMYFRGGRINKYRKHTKLNGTPATHCIIPAEREEGSKNGDMYGWYGIGARGYTCVYLSGGGGGGLPLESEM